MSKNRKGISRSKSWLKYLSKRQERYFAKKYGYKLASVRRKSIQGKMNERARELVLNSYQRKTGWSRQSAEYHFEVPHYFSKRLRQFRFSFDSEYPEESMRAIANRVWRYVKGKKYYFGFWWKTKDPGKSWQPNYQYSRVYQVHEKRSFNESMMEVFRDKLREVYNKYGTGYEYVTFKAEKIPGFKSKNYDIPDIQELSVYVAK